MTSPEQPEPDSRRVAIEKPLLGALLCATPSYDVVTEVTQILEDRHFERGAHALIFNAVQRLHGRNLPTNPIAVANELERAGELVRAGGPGNLHALAMDPYPSASAAYYAWQIRGLDRLERLGQLGARAQQRSRDADPENPDEAIGGHLAEVEQLLADGVGADEDFSRLGDDLEAHLDMLEADASQPVAVTGFTDMDDLMTIEAGQLVLAAGRPGMGKSAFALGVATATAAWGRPVLFCSLEMGRKEVTNRIIAARSRVAFHHLRQGAKGMTDDDWTRIGHRLPELRDLPLWMDYNPRTSPGRIRSRARQITKQTGTSPLIVVDYFGLLSSDRVGKRYESKYAEATDLSRELKLLPRELGCAVLLLAQLNRGPEQRQDKRPMPSDLRDTGALEQDADAIVMIHREDVYEKESPRAGEVDLIVAKHRNGPTATITVAGQLHYSRFIDMAKS